jgi:hypothetical protein
MALGLNVGNKAQSFGIYLFNLATFFLRMDFKKFTKYYKMLGNFSVTKHVTIFAFLQLLSNYRLQRL